MGKQLTVLFVLVISLSANAQILVLGDSLSSAHGMDVAQGWVSILERRVVACQPPQTVINASKSGETSAGGLARLESLLQEHQPELVIIELGGNDGLQGKDIKIIEQTLTQMVQQAKQANAQVLLVEIMIPSYRGFFYTRKFNKMYHRIAKKENVALIPFFAENVNDVAEKTQADMIHPTAEVQMEIYGHVWPYVREAIGC